MMITPAPMLLLVLWTITALARGASEPVDLPAARLLSSADGHGGSIALLAVPIQGREAELLLFKPAPADPVLELRLSVPEDGWYRITTRLVFGPWREGRYGMYRAKADGVDLDGYYHGWYGRGPAQPYTLTWKNWGAVFLRKPGVDLSFHLDAKQAGDLLAIERVRLEPVEAAKLTDAERARRVPERPKTEPQAAWPLCVVDGAEPLTWVTPVPKFDPARWGFKLDGILAEWCFVYPLITVKAATFGGRGYGAPPPESDGDLSLLAQVCWDEKNLYFAACVWDDERAETKPGQPWSSFWSHDGIVLCLHAPPLVRGGRDAQELTMGFNYYSPGCQPRTLPGGVRYAVRPDRDGYSIEAVVPFAALGFAPRVGDRLRFMLIAVDIDPSAPAGQQFQQYLWNTRGGDALRWGEMRLVGTDDSGADLIPERETYTADQSLRFLGVADALRGIGSLDIVDALSKKTVRQFPVRLQLAGDRRHRLRGELPLTGLPPGRYELRATEK